MKNTKKVLLGILASAVFTSGLFAAEHNEFKNNISESKYYSNCDYRNNNYNKHRLNYKKNHLRKRFNRGILSVIYSLNLTDDQSKTINKIILDNRKNINKVNKCFTKKTFDENKFIKLQLIKRENMIKARANIIKEVYSVLTPIQKEQLKVLLDLRASKNAYRFGGNCNR